MSDLELAALKMLNCVDDMLINGEWYDAQRKADNLRDILTQDKPVEPVVELDAQSRRMHDLLHKLDAQHKDYLARRDDEELRLFAAHAMGGMLSRGSFDDGHLAEIAFDYAKAMIDYKNKLKKPPKSRLWQCHCKTMNFGITHCGKCGSLRNDE